MTRTQDHHQQAKSNTQALAACRDGRQPPSPATGSPNAYDPAILADHDFGFVLALSVPDITMSNGLINTDVYVVRTADGSWVNVDATTHLTTQGGGRSVWNEVEAAGRRWTELGRPERSRFGLTVTTSGEQHVWLDRPDNVVTG